MRQGNLPGAARAIAVGLEEIPGNADFQKTLQQIFETAEGAAEAAKRSADSAGASDRSKYIDAASHFSSAAGYRRSGRPADAEAAVREYSTAEKMYQDAVVVVPPPPPPLVGVGPIVNNAKGLIAQGNLTGAARALVEGLKDNPKNSELTGTIVQLYRTAEDEATTRERRRMLRERKTGPSTPMATRAFRQHATRLVPLDRRTRSQSLLNSARPRSSTGLLPRKSGTDPRALDELAIRKLLADYVEAYNTMDVRRVRRAQAVLQRFPQGSELNAADYFGHPHRARVPIGRPPA